MLGVDAGTSSLVSSSYSSGFLNFILGNGMGRRYCTCSSESNIGTLADWHSSVIRERVDHGPSAAFMSRLDQPPLNDRPGVKLESFSHGVQDYCLFLRDRAEV